MNFTNYREYCIEAMKTIDAAEIESALDALVTAYHNGHTIFAIGNGGSASNASHFANDLAKGTLRSMDQTKRMRAVALSDNLALITAYANDEGYEHIFSEQLKNLAQQGDILFAISGSGNSPNVIKAVDWAKQHGMTVIGLTGFSGGKLREKADIKMHVPLDDMCTSEGIHSVIMHYLAIELQSRLYEKI